jgi:hypothetical protein
VGAHDHGAEGRLGGIGGNREADRHQPDRHRAQPEGEALAPGPRPEPEDQRAPPREAGTPAQEMA